MLGIQAMTDLYKSLGPAVIDRITHQVSTPYDNSCTSADGYLASLST